MVHSVGVLSKETLVPISVAAAIFTTVIAGTVWATKLWDATLENQSDITTLSTQLTTLAQENSSLRDDYQYSSERIISIETKVDLLLGSFGIGIKD